MGSRLIKIGPRTYATLEAAIEVLHQKIDDAFKESPRAILRDALKLLENRPELSPPAGSHDEIEARAEINDLTRRMHEWLGDGPQRERPAPARGEPS